LAAVWRSQSSLLLGFSAFALFDILDLSSTIYAVNLGLKEANSILVSLSGLLGVSFVDSFLLLKVLVIFGAGSLLILAIRSSSQVTKGIATILILSLASLFAFAAVNNLIAILTMS